MGTVRISTSMGCENRVGRHHLWFGRLNLCVKKVSVNLALCDEENSLLLIVPTLFIVYRVSGIIPRVLCLGTL